MPEPARRLRDAKAAKTCVKTEFRGDVCVLTCSDAEPGDLAAGLRSGLGRCRDAGASDVLLDVDDDVVLGQEAVGVIKEAAEGLASEGGALVVATEEPAVREALSEAGVMRPSLPPPGRDLSEAGREHSLPDAPRWEHEFVFPADAVSLPPARHRLTAFAEVAGLRGTELFEFSVAVAEALTNAVVHGSPHGADDDVLARFFCYDDEVAVEVVDGGGGLDATPLCVPAASESSGRGIHFMRALCDAVQFTCGPLGTHVLLVKRRD